MAYYEKPLATLIFRLSRAPLRCLALAGNSLGPAIATAVASLLCNDECSIEHLDLSRNMIGDGEWRPWLQQHRSTDTNLQSHKIPANTRSFAADLPHAFSPHVMVDLTGASLRLWDLWLHATLSGGGLQDLAGALTTNRSLRDLCLDSNLLSCVGCIQIAEVTHAWLP